MVSNLGGRFCSNVKTPMIVKFDTRNFESTLKAKLAQLSSYTFSNQTLNIQIQDIVVLVKTELPLAYNYNYCHQYEIHKIIILNN